MKEIIVRTETTDTSIDGTTSTTKTERVEKTEGNGFLEVWSGLVLIFFTALLFSFSYQLVSSIVNNIQSQNNGIQEKQVE